MWTDAHDRPRERLFRRGPRELTDAELLAAVLRVGRSGLSVVELAEALLAKYRDVEGLAAVPARVLADDPGVGPVKAAAVVAAFELGRRVGEYAEAAPLRTAADVAALARSRLAGTPSEEVVLYVTDAAARVRWTVPLHSGPLSPKALPVRAAVEAATAYGGAGLAITRLTADATAVPSEADEAFKTRLHPAARYAGLCFLDYVVVAAGDWCSVRFQLPRPPAPPPRLPPLPAWLAQGKGRARASPDQVA